MSGSQKCLGNIAIVHLPMTELKPDPSNARTHSRSQIKKLAKSIGHTGYMSPIIIDEHSVIIAGHGRLLAAKHLSLTAVPTIQLCHLSNASKRALMLADNKIASDAGWDRKRLAAIIPELTAELEIEGADISLSGFETAEIDQIMVDFTENGAQEGDELPLIEDRAVSQTSDVWLLGPHRLMCGSARKSTDVERLMSGHAAAMSFLDPPYNLKVSSIVGRGKTKYREFAEASGEQSSRDFIAFLAETLRNASKMMKPGALAYVCMDWRHAAQLIEAANGVFAEHINTAIWVKSNAGQGTFYRSQHEQILIFRNGTTAHRNNVMLGRYGRSRSNVWTYPGVNTFRAGRMDDLKAHPTVKPVDLIADAIRDCTKRNDIVLDLFCGSGTTILAAERIGRHCYAMEIDPLYVDCAIRRWQAATGKDAVLEAAGSTFDDVSLSRTAA